MPTWIDVPKLSPRQLQLIPSFSRLDTFTNCPRRYLFDFLFPQPFDSPAQAHGHAVHSQLEAIVAGKPLPHGEAPMHETRLGMKAWESLDASALAVEAWIDLVRDIPFAGRIDVLAQDEDGERLVVDFKTCGSLMKAKSNWEAKRSLQLQIYCLAAECRRAAFIYLPPRGEEFRIADVTFTEKELEVAYRRVKILVEAIRRCWLASGATFDEKGHMIQTERLDLDVWSVANASWFLCSEKWCPAWARCIGGESHGED